MSLNYDRQAYVGPYPPSGNSFVYSNGTTQLPFDVLMQ